MISSKQLSVYLTSPILSINISAIWACAESYELISWDLASAISKTVLLSSSYTSVATSIAVLNTLAISG